MKEIQDLKIRFGNKDAESWLFYFTSRIIDFT
jgi:hypothetical protein